ncbi:MAG: Crp/Fnr family transcriptional regulator [Terriglobales bacterium]
MSAEDIGEILKHATRTDYAAGTTLYRQCETTRQFFWVQSGLVHLTHLTPQGGSILVRIERSGDVFGYFSLVLEGPSVVSATVTTPSRLAVWNSAVAMRLLETFPRMSLNLFAITVRDVRHFYDRTRRLTSHRVGQRVEWALAELARAIGIPSDTGVVVTHVTAQRELADLAGTTVYTVSRELGRLERSGILKKQRGRIIVLQPGSLMIR